MVCARAALMIGSLGSFPLSETPLESEDTSRGCSIESMLIYKSAAFNMNEIFSKGEDHLRYCWTRTEKANRC